MYILKFNELRGPALVAFESRLAYGILDAYFGGNDRQYSKASDKEFTSIELSIMKKVVDLVISELEESWAPVCKIDAQYLRSEINPQFIGIIPPSEVILVATFEIEFESTSGTMTIVIPYSTIEPIKQKLSANYQIEKDMADSGWSDIITEHLQDISCELVASLGSTDVTIGDLITLQKGDVIPLHQDADSDISVMVEGVEKFKTIMGVYKGNKAIQITRLVKK
jgi:flagellar motor switch protein FliM